MNTYLGIEFGSTRIKAVAVDEAYQPVSSGYYIWKSNYTDGVWTYSMDEAWKGLLSALSTIDNRGSVTAVGISGMMHGYLVFDKEWNLLTPFRTWQNTMTGEAAAQLTNLFGINIPQRWSIAHLYQAILNGEPHVKDIAHITTIAGYVHFKLTGVNAVGVCEASGMFPINSKILDYDEGLLEKFDRLTEKMPWNIQSILPMVLPAGKNAGYLTVEGARLLRGLLCSGIPFAPPEGDAGTGMTATNAVAPKTGNVSAGTSIFSMVVLEKPLSRIYPEIDIVSTPEGRPVAMVHCNNCTGDLNAWAEVFGQTAKLLGLHPHMDQLLTTLCEVSLEGSPDCGGITVVNYLAGESVTHFDEGYPLVLRSPDNRFTLENLMKAQLYSTLAVLKIGMEILCAEGVQIDCLTGHGGLFKTPVVGQKYLAAACNSPVSVMKTAGEGGPYGMALLAAFTQQSSVNLGDFLSQQVFKNASAVILQPEIEDVEGFEQYIKRYKAALLVEKAAVENM